MLFESICNSQWFIRTSVILFLNKIDLFKRKLLISPVKKYFPDYQGDPKSYKQASEYFQDNFKRLNRNSSKVGFVPWELEHVPNSEFKGHLRAFHQRHRHEPTQEDNGKCPEHAPSGQPGNTRIVRLAITSFCGVIWLVGIWKVLGGKGAYGASGRGIGSLPALDSVLILFPYNLEYNSCLLLPTHSPVLFEGGHINGRFAGRLRFCLPSSVASPVLSSVRLVTLVIGGY